MGLSLGNYVRKRYWTHLEGHNVVVADMVIEKALIATSKGPQLLQVNVELNGSENTAKCSFQTVDVCLSTPSACAASLTDTGKWEN